MTVRARQQSRPEWGKSKKIKNEHDEQLFGTATLLSTARLGSFDRGEVCPLGWSAIGEVEGCGLVIPVPFLFRKPRTTRCALCSYTATTTATTTSPTRSPSQAFFRLQRVCLPSLRTNTLLYILHRPLAALPSSSSSLSSQRRRTSTVTATTAAATNG